jgi:hypothetical protein
MPDYHTTHNRRLGAGNGIRDLRGFYPSPFFDIASTYLPKTVKETFGWCLFYQQTNPVINPVIQKLSSYPITELVYKAGDDEASAEKFKEFFEKTLDIRTKLVEVNLDRYTFGNAFVTVKFPFKKMLVCPGCKKETPAHRAKYKWKNYQFIVNCDKCQASLPHKAYDQDVKTDRRISLIRWSPKHITLRRSEAVGETYYYYNMPTSLRNAIKLGRSDIVQKIPQVFIEAVKKKKAIVFPANKIFHCRRPSPSRSEADTAWGPPLILPLLKDVFFTQVLKKAQEAVALEHIVPFKVLFPAPAGDGTSPYGTVNLKNWQKEVVSQVESWRKDPNHIAVMPVPIGQEVIGGQGRALLLHQELRLYSEQIISGMGVPVSFFYGEAQYSGASVNLRALENEFLTNRQDLLKLVEFIRDEVASFMEWGAPDLEFKPFKMADDLQAAVFDLQLVDRQMMSKDTFNQKRNLDLSVELKKIEQEIKDNSALQELMMKGEARGQGEASLITTNYQLKAAEVQAKINEIMQPQMAPGDPNAQMGPEGQPPPGAEAPQGDPAAAEGQGEGAVDRVVNAKQLVSQLKVMDEGQRSELLADLYTRDPEMFTLVNRGLHGMGVRTGSSIARSMGGMAGPPGMG